MLFVLVCCFAASVAEADVVVLANEADTHVSFVIHSAPSTNQRYNMAPKDVLPVPTEDKLEIAFDGNDVRRRYQLTPNAIYYFFEQDGKLDLHEANFFAGEDAGADSAEVEVTSPGVGPPVDSMVRADNSSRMGMVPVMILADDEQRLVRSEWERLFRNRLEQASEIVWQYCRIRFRVIAVGTWDSDDTVQDFGQALTEFQIEVIPNPAVLAIGFTSQHQHPRDGTVRLGGIRSPLSRHLLIGEGSKPISEPERLEVLVHELGHYLGAVHCPDPASVMRPLLGDGWARLRAFPIRFDAENTLITYLVASELRSRGVHEFHAMSSVTKRRLQTVYSALSKASPDDVSAKQHLARLEGPSETAPVHPAPAESVVTATRNVVQAIVQEAQENQRNAYPKQLASGQLASDRLTDLCLRRAAKAAGTQPSGLAAKSFLLGLAIALDDSRVLRDNPLTGALCRGVESDEQRRHRITVLGKATMFGRRDLAQHFVVSCGLTALFGPGAAEAVGVCKDVADAQGSSGFSYADLLADMSGVMFAENVLSGDMRLDELAESFRVTDHMPNPAGEQEGISWKEFVESYGSVQDERFQRRREAIVDRIRSLPKHP